MAEKRSVKLFRNGRNQAVRIPAEFELPGGEAIMHRDGDRRYASADWSRRRSGVAVPPDHRAARSRAGR